MPEKSFRLWYVTTSPHRIAKSSNCASSEQRIVPVFLILEQKLATSKDINFFITAFTIILILNVDIADKSAANCNCISWG